MKISVLMLRGLLLTAARLIFIICSTAAAYILSGAPDFPLALIIFLSLRLLLLFPAELNIYSPGGALSAFSAFASIKLYFRALFALVCRAALYALILLPVFSLRFARLLPKHLAALLLFAALMLVFSLILLYQRAFAVPILISNGHGVFSAYRESFRLTRGKIGEIALFYLKRCWFALLPPLILPYPFLSPFLYRAKYRLCCEFARQTENEHPR